MDIPDKLRPCRGVRYIHGRLVRVDYASNPFALERAEGSLRYFTDPGQASSIHATRSIARLAASASARSRMASAAIASAATISTNSKRLTRSRVPSTPRATMVTTTRSPAAPPDLVGRYRLKHPTSPRFVRPVTALPVPERSRARRPGQIDQGG